MWGAKISGNVARLLPSRIAPDNGLQAASLLDLAGTKASVVQQRAEAKDYIDIDAILTDGRVGLPMALSVAKAIYGQQFNPLITLKALSFFEDGDLHRLTDMTKDRLAAAAPVPAKAGVGMTEVAPKSRSFGHQA